jgi:hypothetical protein
MSKGYRVHVLPRVDVIRKKLGMTKRTFAGRFGSSIRQCEQVRGEPEGRDFAALVAQFDTALVSRKPFLAMRQQDENGATTSFDAKRNGRARWSIAAALIVALLLPRSARAQAPRGQNPDLPTAEQYRIEVLAAYWRPSADIRASSDAPGFPGTPIDFKSDLGLTDRGFCDLQLVWRPGLRHRFRLEYIPIHFDVAAMLPRDLLFNGVTYRSGLPVTARLDWATYRFGYVYDFIVKPQGSVGGIAEVKHTNVRGQLRTTGADEVSRQAMPVPAVGAIVRMYPAALLSLTGEVTFFGVPDRADRHYGGHVADIDLSAVWNVTRHLGVQVGFREIDIHHLGVWNTAEFNVKGAYLGALLRY